MGSTTRTDSSSVDLRETRVALFGPPALVGPATTLLRGRRQIGLLGLLATAQGRTVRSERLADELWDGRRVSEAAVRVTVNRLRQRFAAAGVADPIASEPHGYRLELPTGRVDVWQWQSLVDDTRRAVERADVAEVADLARRAAELSARGAAFEGLADLPSVATEADRIERLQVDVALWHGLALLQLARPAAARVVLELAVQRSPMREDATVALMVAAAQEGRRDLAVDAHRRLCCVLEDEIGVSPGATVDDAIDRILSDDGDLEDLRREISPKQWASEHVAPTRTRVDPHDTGLIGREHECATAVEVASAGGIVVLHGSPGSGRSRVVRELAARLDAVGVASSSTSCVTFELGADPILRLVSAVAGAIDLGGVGTPSGGGATLQGELSADYQRLWLHSRVAESLRSVSGPTVLLIDDLQWLDDSAAQLLWHLVQSAPGVGWVLAERDGTSSEPASWLLDALGTLSDRRVQQVALDPLPDDVGAELVRSLCRAGGTQLGDDQVDAVVRSAGGLPALLVECTRQAVSGADLLGASGIGRIMDELLDQLDDDQRILMELVALAGAPMELDVLADAAGLDVGQVATSMRGLGALQLTELHEHRWAVRDLVRGRIARRLDPEHRHDLHRRLAAAALRRDGDEVLVVRHLLDAGPDARVELESEAAAALRRLTTTGSFDEATRLALDLLECLGPIPTSTDGLAARLQIVTVLLSGGHVDQAVALHDLVAPMVLKVGDPVLRGASLLSRSSIDTGGPERDRFVAEALEIIPLIPVEQATLRVTLSCWAAHHLLTSTRSSVALELLESAEQLSIEAGEADLRGIVLAVSYQAALSCERTPEEADGAYRRLCSWTRINPDPVSEAMELLLGLAQAGRNGELAEHRELLDRLEQVCERAPRPDLRWAVAAGRAAEAVASASPEEAATAITAAGELGERLHVGTAAGFLRLHQLQMLHRNGQLAVLSPFLGRVLEPDEQGIAHLTLDGIVADAVGDLERRDRAAELIREQRGPLFGNGTQWVLTAFLLGELAHSVGDPVLGSRVVDELERHRGTGLTLMGLALLGSIDRPIGLAYAAMGDHRNAAIHLSAAVERDERSGQTVFAELARRQLAELTAAAHSKL